MKLTILHLSDIHLRSATDRIVVKAGAIAASAFQSARDSAACLIVVTGDIVFSGTEAEYEVAGQFLTDIATELRKEGCPLVDVVLVPGNHDCKLLPEEKSRSILIGQVVQDSSLARDDSIVRLCTSVQAPFFSFRAGITTLTPKTDHPLWTEYELTFVNAVVRLSAINAAWMSRLPEQPGQLVFPVEMFEDQLSAPCSMRLALIHHPLNWYCQSTYHPLRTQLHAHADAILSGHEHVTNSGLITDTLSGESLFYEAPALQPHERSVDAGLSVLRFDTIANEVVEQRFSVFDDGVRRAGEELVRTLRNSTVEARGQYQLTNEFREVLRDPGGDFHHPMKDTIELDDVFVYPDLAVLAGEDEKIVGADSVVGQIGAGSMHLFMADERGGKTTLLLHAYRVLHQRGFVPIYLRGGALSSTSSRELQKAIEREQQRQYAKPGEVALAPKLKLVALIDDIDRISGGAKGLEKVLTLLQTQHTAVLATASEGFEIAELIGKEAAAAVSKYSTYAILPFGHRLRHQLIRKWCLCGNVTTKQELDERVFAVETILDSIVGRNLVPSLPIYLLILLQSCDRQQQADLQNSGFAHYYQFLITRSLGAAGVKTEELDELFNYLANLAWLFRHEKYKELGFVELRNFNKAFSERFTSVDLASRLALLVRAKILRQHGEHYAFAYPYIYYFFLGKYLANNLDNEEVRRLVGEWCAQLHRRENGHAILFLTHHRNDHWVIDQVVSVLKSSLPEEKAPPMQFDKDVEGIGALVEEASQVLLAAPNVDKNQEQARRLQDEMEAKEEMAEASPREEVALMVEIVRLLKTCEILGQILKNYYGSLERALKETYLADVFDGPLRLMRAIVDAVAKDPEAFAKEIESSIEKTHPEMAPERRRELAKRTGYFVIGQVCTGLVARTAQFVGSEKLAEDVRAVVTRNPTNAYRLIEAATSLMRAGPLPIDLLRRLAEDLEQHPFAFKMLQSLGAFHIRLFHMEESNRQRLCSHLKIEITSAHALDFNAQPAKLTRPG